MKGFERNYTQVDIPTLGLELVPQDEALREDWHRRRRIAEANRRILNEDADLRMAAMERYNDDSRSPLRKLLSRIAVWLGI